MGLEFKWAPLHIRWESNPLFLSKTKELPFGLFFAQDINTVKAVISLPAVFKSVSGYST